MRRELSKLWTLLFLGIWVMLIPAWGIPRQYINTLTFFSGFAVAILSFLLARGIAHHTTTDEEDRS